MGNKIKTKLEQINQNNDSALAMYESLKGKMKDGIKNTKGIRLRNDLRHSRGLRR